MDCTNKDKSLQIVFGDCTLGVHNGGDEGFHYIFSYVAGGLESLVLQGREWLYRVPRPTFWRATTDNDRGNKFPQKSGMWFSADQFIHCIGIRVIIDDNEIFTFLGPENNIYSGKEKADKVEIQYTYETITTPTTQVEVSYQVEETGVINTRVHYYGNVNLPQLPVFGMRFIMPTPVAGFRYSGLSGETYPDRKAGGIEGVYEVKGLPVTPYLMPQDCGMHMDTKWLEIMRNTWLNNTCDDMEERSLRFELDGLAFSCLPYTAGELENATHQEELPLPRRTVLCIYGAVRGVGGIDTWGADVESAFQIDAGKDIDFTFRITISNPEKAGV